jgi:hypothetical protein
MNGRMSHHMPVPTLPRTRQRPGQSLVELTLCLMILLAIIFGGMDALQIMMAHYAVGQAARAAAHQAALDGGPSSAVNDVAKLILDASMSTRASKATIHTTCDNPCDRFSPVTVEIAYQDQLWAPLWPGDATFSVRKAATRTTEKDAGSGTGSATANGPGSGSPPQYCGIPGGPPCP